MTTQTKTITVAAAQLPARPLPQAAEALTDIADVVAAAARAAADLVVLPECSYPAYWLGSTDRYFRADILRGPAIEAWFSELARQHRIAIIAGLVHERDGVLHDTAALFDATGVLRGLHFKTFLWDAEHNWYEPGGRVQPVEAMASRIGMIVCAEGRSPEVFASHAAQGAALLAMPTAWVNAAGKPGEYYNPQPDFMIQARASEFGLPIICANKFGQECPEAQFCGMSLIVSGDGIVLAKAPADEPALLVAQVRLKPKRLLLPEATVHRLLDNRPPVLPPADAETLRVAVLPPHLPGQSKEEGDAMLAGRGVDVVFDPASATEQAVPVPQRGAMSQLQTIAHARVGLLKAGQVRSFVWPRLLAMDGAQVLCVVGPLVDLPRLRVRAVENRVFVVAAPDNCPTIVGPNGQVLAQAAKTATEPLIVDLELAQAAGKVVAPQTHIWAERRCGAYCLVAGDR